MEISNPRWANINFDQKLLFLMTLSELQNHAVKESSFARRILAKLLCYMAIEAFLIVDYTISVSGADPARSLTRAQQKARGRGYMGVENISEL